MIQSDIEATFVNTFIARSVRERWHTRLGSTKTRPTLLNRQLPISLRNDLDPRYVYDKEDLPVAVAPQVRFTFTTWKQANPLQRCYIIAASDARDSQWMSLPEAETDFKLSFGAIIILIPNRLAYYHTERSNIVKYPFYVLFRRNDASAR